MIAVRPTRLLPQPIVGAATCTLAVASLSTLLLTRVHLVVTRQDVVTACLAMGLLATIVLSYKFPIHVDRSTKIYLNSVPLYLIAALLPTYVAGAVAGLGVLGGEFAVRKERKNYCSDVITAAGRWTLVALLAASAAHLPVFTGLLNLPGLVIGALVMWAGDSFTAPLVIGPMVRERPFAVLVKLVRESAAPEAAQYLLAMPGALVVAREPWALGLLVLPVVLVYRHFKRMKELHDGTRRLLERMADTVDQRDAYTGGHSRRVATLTAEILHALPLTGPEADLIIWAARVHDIGKINLPDRVLQKPGALTASERALMQAHPDRGADLLQSYPGFARGAEIVRYHHEAWDGSGYPRGLRESAIPFGARIIAVADSYDAMTSDRPYRTGMSPAQAVKRLMHGRGQQWDPEIVDALLRTLPELAEHAGPSHLRLVLGAVEPDDSFAVAQ